MTAMTRLVQQRVGVVSHESVDNGEYNLAGIRTATIERSRQNMRGIKEAYTRAHAASMQISPPVQKKSVPAHLLATFK